jgi:hypothetical protein
VRQLPARAALARRVPKAAAAQKAEPVKAERRIEIKKG